MGCPAGLGALMPRLITHIVELVIYLVEPLMRAVAGRELFLQAGIGFRLRKAGRWHRELINYFTFFCYVHCVGTLFRTGASPRTTLSTAIFTSSETLPNQFVKGRLWFSKITAHVIPCTVESCTCTFALDAYVVMCGLWEMSHSQVRWNKAVAMARCVTAALAGSTSFANPARTRHEPLLEIFGA